MPYGWFDGLHLFYLFVFSILSPSFLFMLALNISFWNRFHFVAKYGIICFEMSMCSIFDVVLVACSRLSLHLIGTELTLKNGQCYSCSGNVSSEDVFVVVRCRC